MNRVIKINNYVNQISTKEMEFKINELYSKNEIVPLKSNNEIVPFKSNNEIVPNNSKICRYCWEEDDREYISPCLCKGGSKFIHIECLNKWRIRHYSNPIKKNSCEICKYKYKFKQHDTTNYVKYFINVNKYYCLHLLIIWFIAMFIIWIEILSDFFLIRTLNFYNYNNSSLLKIFRDMKLNEDIFYMLYSLFYLPFSFFLFELRYMYYFHLKCYKLFPNINYKSKLNNQINMYYIQSFLFLYYYYFCLFCDIPIFYIYSSISTVIFNTFYRINFFNKHNKIINIIINNIESTEEILSFEDNPLLGVNFDEIDGVISDVDSCKTDSSLDSSISSNNSDDIFNNEINLFNSENNIIDILD
jgi:hypothetical protein